MSRPYIPPPPSRGGLGSTFKRPARSVTWPGGAVSGQTRIIAGADTPPELVAYGVVLAILFYVVDIASGLEAGYFFIGQSNILDVGADNDVLLFGEVLYPTAGDPSSPTAANVKTHFQIELWNTRSSEGFPNQSFTIFKDATIQTSVPTVFLVPTGQLQLDAGTTMFFGANSDPNIRFQSTGGVFFELGSIVFDPVNVFFTDGQILFDNNTIIVSNTASMEFDSGNELRMETGSRFSIAAEIVSPKNELVNSQAMASGNTSSTSLANMPGPVSVTIDKLYGSADTDLIVEMHGTIHGDGTDANSGGLFGVAIGGVDYTITGLWHTNDTAVGNHATFSGVERITGIAAGSRTLTARWRASSAGHLIATDSGDFLSILVREVPV